jgi:hypothetical protein
LTVHPARFAGVTWLTPIGHYESAALRAEEAREVAGQLTDPGARKSVLELAESWRGKTANETGDFSHAFLSRAARCLWRSKTMGQQRGILTPEERARVMQLQDLLIERFVEHREAVAEGQEERVRTVEAQIDSLLREKEEIEKWAAVGSA